MPNMKPLQAKVNKCRELVVARRGEVMSFDAHYMALVQHYMADRNLKRFRKDVNKFVKDWSKGFPGTRY